VRRASFLGAQVDYLIDVVGREIRAALPSHECLDRDLLFTEGEACRVSFATVQWFEADAIDEEAR
jgi:iron(III) transport system ATP-binding protein